MFKSQIWKKIRFLKKDSSSLFPLTNRNAAAFVSSLSVSELASTALDARGRENQLKLINSF